jgi:hypothetical protein
MTIPKNLKKSEVANSKKFLIFSILNFMYNIKQKDHRKKFCGLYLLTNYFYLQILSAMYVAATAFGLHRGL